MKIKLGGLWPAMLTPLDESGAPNHGEIEKLVELFIRQQLGGLYVLGSTGQWPLLSMEHRQEVVERVVRVATGRIPVIVHVGAASTDDAVKLARHAASIGADGISSVAPIYYPASADIVFEHYRRIGQAGELPLFIYHLSLVNKLTLDPKEYAERVLAVPNIAGMKITDHDLYQFGLLHTFAGDRLTLFSGADELLCHAALSGAAGAIGTFYNLWGPTCQSARKAFVNGSFEVGRRFMLAFQSAIAEVIGSQAVWMFLRAAMRLKYGIDVGPPRRPLGLLEKPWKEAEVERIIVGVEKCIAAPAPAAV